MKKNLFNLLLLLVSLMGLQVAAAIPSGYYSGAVGKSDQELMMALHKKIKGHTKRTYKQLWTDFGTTDCIGTTIIDRYSDSQFTYVENQCGNYNGVGDCYNREHSIPNSWWGSSDTDTAYTDLHHLIPTDGFVNSKRGNYPFGDCDRGTTYGTGKLGTCTHSGYSGTVFEVADEYKGDFARMYFYFATRYMPRMSHYTSDTGGVVFTASSYLGLTTWAISQLLEWHRNDPVSQLETNRNDAVYGIQSNRNPFVDHPELVEYIWGNQMGNIWSGSATNTPTILSPANGSTVNVGTNTGNGVSKSITVKGLYMTKPVTVSVTGAGFSVSPTTLTAAAVNAGTTVTVTYNGTTTNATGYLTISNNDVSSVSTLVATYSAGGVEEEEFIETWEGCGTGGYWTKEVQGKAFSWYFTDAGIWADTNKNDALSCRFGNTSASSIEMTEDVASGTSKVSFYAAKWKSSDAAPTLQVQYSTNGGSTWTTAGTCSPDATWRQYVFNMNVNGNVRIRIVQTVGARLNIDDITITSNSTPIAEPQLTAPVDGSTIDVGTIAAGETQVTKAITVKGTDLTKPLNLTVIGSGFSVTPTTVSAASANAGTTVTVTYSSNQAGNATGRLTISSSEVSASLIMTARKVADPTISITSLDEIEAFYKGESSIVTGIVTADNNDEDITLTVGQFFVISLDQMNWSNSLTLDPSGEVFYVKLANTETLGEFSSQISASTSLTTAYADVQGTVREMMGDVNLDGTVDVSDVTAVISYVLGGHPSPFSEYAANINGDQIIDISDVTAVIAIVLNTNTSKVMTWNAVPADGGILVNNPLGDNLEIYDLDANCVAMVDKTSASTIKLPAGVYLVTSDTISRKVVVK